MRAPIVVAILLLLALAQPHVVSGQGASYFTITPCRLLDTRTSGTPITLTAKTIQVGSRCGVPTWATAIAGNLVAVAPSDYGLLRLSPGGTSPETSTLNYRAGLTRANNVVMSIAPARQLDLVSSGTVDAVIDLFGYFTASSGVPAARPVAIGTVGGGALAASANVGLVRIGAYWRGIQPTPDPDPSHWNWVSADATVNDARSYGQEVLFILSGSPQWATPGVDNPRGNYPPTDISLWRTYVGGVSRHMCPRIAAYEIWNEPDLSGSSTFGVGWDRDLSQYPTYADYLIEASRLIHANCPGTLVVGPGITDQGSGRVNTLLSTLENTIAPEGPASSFVDVLSGHVYAGTSGDGLAAASQLRAYILDRISTFNPSNVGKEFWLTEFGWNSNAVGTAAQRTGFTTFFSA